MTDPVLLRDMLLAGEGVAASVLLPVLAWLAASCFPGRAALRHLIWLAGFVGLLALLPLTLLLPAHFVIERVSAPAPVASLSVSAIAPGAPAMPLQMRAGKSAPKAIATGVATRAPWHFGLAQLAITAFALWLFGLGAILLYQAMALLALRRLRRRCTALAPPPPEFQGRWRLCIAADSDACGPLTWGIWRPVILLPQHALRWPHERLVAVLTHEISHVRRHDMLAQVLAQLACALYWPNPLVWLGAQRLRQEAETAADDAVLSAGVKPSTYAETLMALAAEFREGSPGLAMAAPSRLEARITSVLTSTQSRTGVTAMDVFKTACLGSSAVILIALARPDLAVAQQAAPATPVAAVAVTEPVAVTEAAPASVAPVLKFAHKAAATGSPTAQLLARADENKSEAQPESGEDVVSPGPSVAPEPGLVTTEPSRVLENNNGEGVIAEAAPAAAATVLAQNSPAPAATPAPAQTDNGGASLPYQGRAQLLAYGYSEVKKDDSHYAITYSDNNKKSADDRLELRAAQLAQGAGYHYFAFDTRSDGVLKKVENYLDFNGGARALNDYPGGNIRGNQGMIPVMEPMKTATYYYAYALVALLGDAQAQDNANAIAVSDVLARAGAASP